MSDNMKGLLGALAGVTAFLAGVLVIATCMTGVATLPTLPARPTVGLAAPLPTVQEPIWTPVPAATPACDTYRGITGEWSVCR